MTFLKIGSRDIQITTTAAFFQLAVSGADVSAASLENRVPKVGSIACESASGADFKEQMRAAMNPNFEPLAPQTPPDETGCGDDDPWDYPIAAE